MDPTTPAASCGWAVICGGVYTWLDPSRGPGQVGGEGEAIWQFATYRGQEAVALDKCYWNLAIGLDVGEGGAAEDCRLVAYATASHASFGDKRRSPENTVYPYVAYEVQLTNSSADFMCNGAPLDGGGGVHTGYTLPRGKDFPWEWECSPTAAIFESRVLCAGQTGPDAATFVDTPGGIVFGFGDKLSPLYTLPDDRHIRGCCANPCPKCAP